VKNIIVNQNSYTMELDLNELIATMYFVYVQQYIHMRLWKEIIS